MAKGKKKMTVHKKTPNTARPNGKAWKQYPKGFNTLLGRLVTDPAHKGETYSAL